MFSFSILTTAFVMSPLLKVSLEKCRFRLAVYILIFGSRLVNSNYLTNSLIGNK